MAQVFLRTKKEEGNAKLYTLVRRNGLQLQVCTGIVVNIKEWQKSEKSQSAKTKYCSTIEGKRVNEQIVSVNQAIDQLFKDGLIKSNDDKHLIEEAISDIVLVESQKVKDQAKAIKKEQEGHNIYEKRCGKNGPAAAGDNNTLAGFGTDAVVCNCFEF